MGNDESGNGCGGYKLGDGYQREQAVSRSDFRAGLVGRRFDSLIVKEVPLDLNHVLCECDCGTVKTYRLYNLIPSPSKPRATRSCGCKKLGNSAKMTKEFLEEHYVRLGKTSEQIASEVGVFNGQVVAKALKRHGISYRHPTRGLVRPAQRNKFCGELSGTYWNHVRANARKRGIPFSVSIEQAWGVFVKQMGMCALSGVPIQFRRIITGSYALAGQTASLDRIISSDGYTADNIQWVHKLVNNMKMDSSDSEFAEWCLKVAKHKGLAA